MADDVQLQDRSWASVRGSFVSLRQASQRAGSAVASGHRAVLYTFKSSFAGYEGRRLHDARKAGQETSWWLAMQCRVGCMGSSRVV